LVTLTTLVIVQLKVAEPLVPDPSVTVMVAA
jgi:hypothetical protein